MDAWELVVAFGIPSAIIGGIVSLNVWRLQKRIEKEAKERKQREEARHQHEQFLVKMLTAVSVLCEANATALQNGRCNGETHAALEYMLKTKREQRDFLMSQGIDHLF